MLATIRAWGSSRQLRNHLGPNHPLALSTGQLLEVSALPHLLPSLHPQHLHLPLRFFHFLLQGYHLLPGFVQLLLEIVICSCVSTSLGKPLFCFLPLPLCLLQSPHCLFLCPAGPVWSPVSPSPPSL